MAFVAVLAATWLLHARTLSADTWVGEVIEGAWYPTATKAVLADPALSNVQNDLSDALTQTNAWVDFGAGNTIGSSLRWFAVCFPSNNFPASGAAISSAKIRVNYAAFAGTNGQLAIHLSTNKASTKWYKSLQSASGSIATNVIVFAGGSETSYVWDATSYLNTTNKINNCEVLVLNRTNSNGRLYLDYINLEVVYAAVNPPVINNDAGATGIAPDSAVLNGEVVQGGPDPRVWIYWGTNNAGQSFAWSNTIDKGAVPVGTFSNKVTGLLANKTYYYRCYGTNIYGTNWAPSTAVFTTLPARVEFAVTNMSGLESNSPVQLQLVLSATSAVPVSVDYSIVGGTASNGQDYSLATGTALIPAGSLSTYIDVTITNETMYEEDETFIVGLSNPVGGTLGYNTQCVYAILNDDLPPAVSFSGTPYWILENLTNITIHVALSEKSGKTTSVGYGTSNGTASNIVDYTNATGTFTWTPGQSDVRSFTVPIVDNAIYEPGRFFYVSLLNATNCAIVGGSTAIVNIIDNDAGPPVVNNEPGPGAVTSNSATLYGTLMSTGGAPTSVWIYWGPLNGDTNKGSWYTNVSLGVRDTSAAFSTNITGLTKNTQYWYRCYASNSNDAAGAWAPTSTNFLTGPPIVQFAPSSVGGSETNSPASLALRLSSPSVYGVDVTVQYSVTGGTASNGTDYSLLPGTATIAAGTPGTSITFAVLNDSIYEADETVVVTISNVQNAIAGAATNGTYTILNDDPAPTVSYTNTPYYVRENGTNITITVTLSTNCERTVSVAYATSNGTAAAGIAYTNTSGVLTWLRGESGGRQFAIPIIDNTAREGNKLFYINLSNANGCTVSGDSMAIVDILEDDYVAPIVTNDGGASNVLWTTATLNGYMAAAYPPAIRYIYWGPNDCITNRASWTNQIVIGPSVGPGLFSAPIDGLIAGKTYYYRCYATNSEGTNWANTTCIFTTAPPVVAGVSNYYVNDSATAGDLYSMAAGSAANSGTNRAQPKASIQEILNRYDLGPGDAIWIDAGYYDLSAASLTITNNDFGSSGQPVVLRGATGLQGTVLDRVGKADHVIKVSSTSGGGYLRFESLVVLNGNDGIDVRGTSGNYFAGMQIIGCTAHDNGTSGIYMRYCDDALVSNSICYNNISASGIDLSYCSDPILTGNQCYSNYLYGIRIYSSPNLVVAFNSCFDQIENGSGIGISSGGGIVRSNRCYNNYVNGINMSGGASSLVAGNICWSNITSDGITIIDSGPTVIGNVAYKNGGIGLKIDSGAGSARISNNLLHGNAEQGLYLSKDDCRAMIENNTIYGGKGVYIANPLQVTNRNNIVWSDGSGNACIEVQNLPLPSAVFASDYNDLYATGDASVGSIVDPPAVMPVLGDWTNGAGTDASSISVDPLFVSLADPVDFHLQSPAGSWHSGTWQSDAAHSPCIDAGDPRCVFSSEPDYNGFAINQGAYGNTPEASRTFYDGPFYSVAISTQPVSAGWARMWPIPSLYPAAGYYPTNRLITVWAGVTNQAYLWTGWTGSVVNAGTQMSFYATGTMSVVASFAATGSQSSAFAITATAWTGGWITPNGAVSVPSGASQSFIITADTGYMVSNVLVDASWKGPTNGWTFSGVTNNHAIDVWFSTLTTNGTPVWWLQSYGFSNDLSAADLTDNDHDGLLAWEEYQAGTLPNNSTSVFKVLRLDYRPSSNSVIWYATTNSGVNTFMSVYRLTNIRASAWDPYASNITRAATGTNQWWDTNLPAAHLPVFYMPVLTTTNR